MSMVIVNVLALTSVIVIKFVSDLLPTKSIQDTIYLIKQYVTCSICLDDSVVLKQIKFNNILLVFFIICRGDLALSEAGRHLGAHLVLG
jgi:hypothetical protein